MFSSLATRLGPDLGGAIVLDAYAGTGALGLEALSRGASRATFTEVDRSALSALRENVSALQAKDRATIVAADVKKLANAGPLVGGPFTLLFLDPPYRIDTARTCRLLEALAESGSLTDGAYVVWERASNDTVDWPRDFEVLYEKRYGSTTVAVAEYRRGYVLP